MRREYPTTNAQSGGVLQRERRDRGESLSYVEIVSQKNYNVSKERRDLARRNTGLAFQA
jgi:hypothetical protein